MSDLLNHVREALREPFVDPVLVLGLPVPRADARAVERALCGRGGSQGHTARLCPLAAARKKVSGEY